MPKALLKANDDESFVERACAVLRQAGVFRLRVVVSPDILAAVAGLLPHVDLEVNADPGRGQLSSLQIAIRALPVDTRAAVVLPVDVPLVRTQTVRALIDARAATGPFVVRPSRGGRHGHPVIFDRAVFAELLEAPLAEGAKAVVRKYASRAGDVPVLDDEGAFTDIDTVEDYLRAFNRLPERVSIR